jgi:drug/metabolite transporter (DMT)-like permease
MKHAKVHMPNISYIAAFVVGVILFAVVWKLMFNSASSAAVLAGMAGAAVAVIAFWFRNEHHGKEKQ